MGHLVNADIVEKMKSNLVRFIRKVKEGGEESEGTEEKHAEPDEDQEEDNEEENSEEKQTAELEAVDTSGDEKYQILRKTDEGDVQLPQVNKYILVYR